ncbi:preprotein translocase subunit SecG [Clostridium collagenovorans DSM 3089]|uniref:Protein-export membrane protein SecG n=1 Tax=Clostridium collagenovorans DSM 3089 TaxID=1121306 RepID=A0A1M5XZR0_9CLOT|nr:preprotein translocase subunit SecG [Clostridium collagenovorans]SHI05206.1 preprotein translocase subunit SecG [Clostridium collagenovorans DSM 3089]
MKTVLIGVLLVLSLIIIISIMLQPSKSDGLSGLIMGGNHENYFAKNKVKTYEKTLARVTVVSSALFAIVVIVINLI